MQTIKAAANLNRCSKIAKTKTVKKRTYYFDDIAQIEAF